MTQVTSACSGNIVEYVESSVVCFGSNYEMKRISQLAKASLVVAVVIFSARVYAAPGDILFSDDFERGNLAPWTTTDNAISGILTGAQVSGSPNRGGYTSNDPVTVTSPTFNTAVPAAEISVWVRRGSDAFSEDTDNNENLALEYRRADGTWGALNVYLGSGTNGQIYQDTFALPADALHGSFAIRFRQTAGSGFDWDYWHFDDTVVTERAPAPPFGVGQCDFFEGGLGTNWTVNATSGFAGTSSATFLSPSRSMYTNGGVVEVTSTVIDTTNPAFASLSMWVRRGSDSFSEDPDGGENLIVEYRDDTGGWVSLETFTGNGTPGAIFVRSYPMPFAGRHANFQIRFRQTGGNGAPWDFWHVDDVCLDTQPFPNISVNKAVRTLSDPLNGNVNPFAIPGAVVEYTIAVANNGDGAVDADSLTITDTVPADTELFVDSSGGDPVVFVDGAVPSGLTYVYASSVSYSSQPGGVAPYNYVPVPDADGFDAAVTGLRITFAGTMDAAGGGSSPSFDILLQLRVR